MGLPARAFSIPVRNKASYDSWVQPLTPFDSWTLTAGILLSKVLFFSKKKDQIMTSNCVIFQKNQNTLLDVEIQVL